MKNACYRFYMKCELRKNFGDKRQHKKSPFRGFFYFFYCPGEDLLTNLSYSKCDLRISPFPSRFAVKAAFRLASSPENKNQKSSMKEHLNSRNPKRGLNRRNEWISFRVAMVKILSFLCLCKKALAFMVPRRGLVPLVRFAHCRRRLGTDMPFRHILKASIQALDHRNIKKNKNPQRGFWFFWCPGEDLNLHALRRRLLRPLCLPFHHLGADPSIVIL